MKILYPWVLGIITLCCFATTSIAQTDSIPPVELDFHIEFTDIALNDSVGAVFTLTYSEDVELIDTFMIVTHHYKQGVWELHDRYDNTEVVVEGNVLTVTPERSFWAADRYEFIVTSGSVTDKEGNSAGSFYRTFVADQNAPEVIDLSIILEEDETKDSASAVFTLIYSEDVKLTDNFTIVTHVFENGLRPEYDRYNESEITVNGNVITVSPERMFSMSQQYEFVVAFGSVTDIAGNWATSFTRTFRPDVTPPVVIDFESTFTNSEFADSVNVSFVLSYNEDVKLARTYKFITYHHNAGVWEEYEQLADTSILVTGNTISLNPTRVYSSSDTYELVVTAGSVEDLIDNPATSFTEIFLIDTIRPKLIDISPDLSQLVATNAIFTFTFDENVRLANNFGFYTYHWNADSAKYLEYEQLDASQVTIENNVVTFNPSLDFRSGQRVQIVLTSGSVLDMEGNRFQYVRDNDTINYVSERFWTVDSVVSLVTFLPFDKDSISFIPDELSIIFSEAITLIDTTAVNSLNIDTLVYLRSESVDLEHTVSFNSTVNTITIVPTEELVWGSTYTFGFIDGFLNEAMDSIPAGEATFTILDYIAVIEGFTIAEVNGQGEISPEPGQVVRITGTVTGIYPDEGFFVQDAAERNSGIWVEYANTTDFVVGDGVVVTGMADTLQGVIAFIAEEVTTADSPLTIVPLIYTLGTDPLPMYQNVLIQIVDARASEADVNGEWVLYADGDADSVVVTSRMFDFSPDGSGYYNVTGIVTGWDSIYQVEPRMDTDISEVTRELFAIAEIHGDTFTSPFLGQKVQIQGTVTAVYPDEGFFVQDEIAAKGGIWVEYTDTLQPEVGEGVAVTGTVEELNGITSLVAVEVNKVDEPLTIEPIVLNFGSDSIPMYQGVLVQVANARASDANMDGDWMLFADNDLDSVIIGSRLYAFTSVTDNSYDVTGVVTFRGNIYRIEPQMEADIMDVTVPTSVDLLPGVEFNVYPNPFENVIKISNNDKLTRVIVSNITGQRVVDVAYPKAEINTSHLVSGVYIINMFNDTKIVKTSRIIKR